MSKILVTLVAVLLLLVCCSKDEPIYVDQKPIALIKKDSLTELNIYPNPFKSNLAVAFKSSQSDRIKYSFFDLVGRMMISGEFKAAKYSNEIMFKLDTLENGVYILRLEAFNEFYIRKIVKQN